MSVISEKPNLLNKENTDMAERSKRIPKYIFSEIDHYFSRPQMRYSNPVTSSHELGWFQDNQLNKGLKHHPKLSCFETKYANDYYAMKGRSPYASKTIVIKEDKK